MWKKILFVLYPALYVGIDSSLYANAQDKKEEGRQDAVEKENKKGERLEKSRRRLQDVVLDTPNFRITKTEAAFPITNHNITETDLHTTVIKEGNDERLVILYSSEYCFNRTVIDPLCINDESFYTLERVTDDRAMDLFMQIRNLKTGAVLHHKLMDFGTGSIPFFYRNVQISPFAVSLGNKFLALWTSFHLDSENLENYPRITYSTCSFGCGSTGDFSVQFYFQQYFTPYGTDSIYGWEYDKNGFQVAQDALEYAYIAEPQMVPDYFQDKNHHHASGALFQLGNDTKVSIVWEDDLGKNTYSIYGTLYNVETQQFYIDYLQKRTQYLIAVPHQCDFMFPASVMTDGFLAFAFRARVYPDAFFQGYSCSTVPRPGHKYAIFLAKYSLIGVRSSDDPVQVSSQLDSFFTRPSITFLPQASRVVVAWSTEEKGACFAVRNTDFTFSEASGIICKEGCYDADVKSYNGGKYFVFTYACNAQMRASIYEGLFYREIGTFGIGTNIPPPHRSPHISIDESDIYLTFFFQQGAFRKQYMERYEIYYPTRSPTLPTISPTLSPTKIPTQPTEAPVRAPTSVTAAPIPAPTTSPTQNTLTPTQSTMAPTIGIGLKCFIPPQYARVGEYYSINFGKCFVTPSVGKLKLRAREVGDVNLPYVLGTYRRNLYHLIEPGAEGLYFIIVEGYYTELQETKSLTFPLTIDPAEPPAPVIVKEPYFKENDASAFIAIGVVTFLIGVHMLYKFIQGKCRDGQRRRQAEIERGIELGPASFN